MKGLIFIFGLLVSLMASANQEFDKGVKFANHANFDSALVAFNNVISKEPKNASAFYNIGYCYFQQKQYGQAIWAFEKAIQYEPKHANALKNLEICHFKLDLPSYTPIHSSLMRSLFSFGSNSWSIVGILCSIIIGLLALLFVLKKSIGIKRIALVAIFFLICIGITSTILAYLTNASFNETNGAIVIIKEIPTYLTVSGEKSPITLPEGTRIIDLQELNENYYQGLLLNGQEVMIDNKDWKKL